MDKGGLTWITPIQVPSSLSVVAVAPFDPPYATKPRVLHKLSFKIASFTVLSTLIERTILFQMSTKKSISTPFFNN